MELTEDAFVDEGGTASKSMKNVDVLSQNWTKLTNRMNDRFSSMLPRRYQLVTDAQVRQRSLNAVRFAVLCSSINTKVLNPNFPIMVGGAGDSHTDAFPDTEPFDYNSATYFLPMCSLLGVAIASTFLGGLSDRVGRKRVLMILGIVTTIGSIVKYFSRHTFWAFCIANLVFGFFLGNLPVAMAYAGDVCATRKEKEDELGIMVGMFVMGNSGGGVIAILMNDSGLFAPLWVAAAMMGLSCVALSWYMVDSAELRKMHTDDIVSTDNDDDFSRPEFINKPVMWNVVLGALADNIGSVGLFPLCMSPLAIEQYLSNPELEEPIMTVTGYQWLVVMVAPMVVPSTKITPYVFERIGPSGACVLGNVITAVVTMALLFIGNGDASRANFAWFVSVLYAGFPFTVFSQLSTGPMLDVLSPEDQIGYVQGLNNAAMNFGMALAPWVLGMMADAVGTNAAIWTGIGISFAAALINTPLTFRKEMGPPEKKPPVERRILPGEDVEWTTKALSGEYVPADILFELNQRRLVAGQSPIIPKVRSYEEEKDKLSLLRQHAQDNFAFREKVFDRALQEISSPASDSKDMLTKDELCKFLNVALGAASDESRGEARQDLGAWIVDYLADNGYNPHVTSFMIKQMVLSAFPSITQEKELTPESLETALLKQRRVFGMYASSLRRRQPSNIPIDRTLGQGSAPVFYS